MQNKLRLIILLLIFWSMGFISRQYRLPPHDLIRDISKIFRTAIVPTKGGIKTTSCKNYRFTLVNKKAKFEPRDGAGALYFNKKLFLIAGWYPSHNRKWPKATNNEVWVSNNFGETWDLIKPNTYGTKSFDNKKDFMGRFMGGYVNHNGYMYILGGDIEQKFHINDVWRSKNGKEWELVNPKPPWSPRVKQITFSYRDYIYVMGGQTHPLNISNQNVNETYYRDIWKSKNGKVWEKVEVKKNIPYSVGGIYGQGFVHQDQVYIPGGASTSNPKLANKESDIYKAVWTSKDKLEVWEKISDQGQSKKFQGGLLYHDTAIYDNKIWTIGGFRKGSTGKREGSTNEIWFSDKGINWTRLNCSPIIPTHASLVWSTPKGIVIAGGYGFSRQVWRLSKIE